MKLHSRGLGSAHFVKRYYQHDAVKIRGEERAINFPKPEVREMTNDLNAALPGLFDRFAHALACSAGECDHESPVSDEPTLQLARYVTSRFQLSGETESYEVQLAGLLRSGLLKRFEGSAAAFAVTCERMATSHDAFLSLLYQRKVASGTVVSDWVRTNNEDLDEFLKARKEAIADASGTRSRSCARPSRQT